MADATAAVYRASSPDGAITVDTDGRPRVVATHIDPRAMRLDTDALSAALIETLNAGLRASSAGSSAAVLDGLDPALRSAVTAAIATSLGQPVGGTATDTDRRQW